MTQREINACLLLIAVTILQFWPFAAALIQTAQPAYLHSLFWGNVAFLAIGWVEQFSLIWSIMNRGGNRGQTRRT